MLAFPAVPWADRTDTERTTEKYETEETHGPSTADRRLNLARLSRGGAGRKLRGIRDTEIDRGKVIINFADTGLFSET
ncbi:hypothetical protein CGCF413_v010262 [Colletotrichum fructicola]|nr:hypothetical protein CGCF413_v010262 [Colletotrichum fructicola]